MNSMIKNIKLTKVEKKLEQEVLEGKWQVTTNMAELKKVLEASAAQHVNKTKNINLRLSESVLRRLKLKSSRLGIPYQTIVGSLVSQYVEGKLKVSL